MNAIVPALEAILGRRRRQHQAPTTIPVEVLLALDARYRDQAAAGKLSLIAPKRFNPTGAAWLPIMHAAREGWHFTVLYSNTATAHRLDRNFDWVVIYFYDDDDHEGQHTVVTETHGELRGRRVVRGREAECRDYYANGDGGSELVAGKTDSAFEKKAPVD